ncbi:hypothetical protein GGU11DRAFT_747627 [Lentinula aff. detonsa]|nr:hypothetical protein GGU11DRAFT_747627 [Lentinula aff. detonsa]
MLSQTMKFLLGTLVLALVVSSQVQAAAIPISSRMSTDKADGTSTSTAVRRSDVEPAEMLEMREMSDTAEWDLRRRKIASLVASHVSKLSSLAHNVQGAANTEKNEQGNKGIQHIQHHTALQKLTSLVSTKAAAPAKPIEPARPHEAEHKPAELPKPSEGEPPSQQPKESVTEKAMKAAELAKEGAGAAGSVGATVSALKGGDQAPVGAADGDGGNAPVPTNNA